MIWHVEIKLSRYISDYDSISSKRHSDKIRICIKISKFVFLNLMNICMHLFYIYILYLFYIC